MIRTEIKTFSLRSFYGIDNLTIDMGLGQSDSEHSVISDIISGNNYWVREQIRAAFKQSGFANESVDRYKLLPCEFGTYVNTSAETIKCIECPAGGFYSDTKAFVNDGCRQCPSGTFVHYNEAPGKSQVDCKTCPEGTNTTAFAGFRACKCLKDHYRTNLFGACKPCELGLECQDDCANLKDGFWWKWKNKTHRELYRNFTKTAKDSSFTPELHNANDSRIVYPYTIPHPYRCPMTEACKGGLNSSCNSGYEGPLCAVCSDGYYKQLKKCKLCPTKGRMIGQFAIMGAIVMLLVIIVVWRSKKKSKKMLDDLFLTRPLEVLKLQLAFIK
ncbi:unnamed protein product [Porites lobata]|uniref:DUF7630 domain-containing protein n=1 Tax=Porites lobata TaxID=104759 RepID=A0ABN8RUM6_9CNID|nr:unnamed protein product [Porites lobata]